MLKDISLWYDSDTMVIQNALQDIYVVLITTYFHIVHVYLIYFCDNV